MSTSHPSEDGNRTDRRRLLARVALYSAIGLGWAVFAIRIVPPLLRAEQPGPFIAALKRHLHVPPMPFFHQDLLVRWREFAGAVLFAMALHLGIVAILTRRGAKSSRGLNFALGIAAAAFLAVAVLAPMRQDYFLYLQIWYEVRQGHDPWFRSPGMDGIMPINAYGPLYNLLAIPAGLNPLAPRLLLSSAYILFAIIMTRGLAAGGPPSRIRALGWSLLLWNPFAWVEVAFYGHFDILVGLACLGAVRAWDRGRDARAGAYLAAGVLLKYIPIVLLPFLAFDRYRYRPRIRFLTVTLAAIAAGLGLSALIWGRSTFAPLDLAANRKSAGLSIFWFLRRHSSSLAGLGLAWNTDELAPIAQFLALGLAWWWSRARKPDVEATALVAVLLLILFYRVGYPQYQMVPFVLGVDWLLRVRSRPRKRAAAVVAMALDFGWLAACDVAYMLHEAWSVGIEWEAHVSTLALPTFLFGIALVACVVRAATPGEPDASRRPHAPVIIERSDRIGDLDGGARSGDRP